MFKYGFLSVFLFCTLLIEAQGISIPISKKKDTVNGKIYILHTVEKGQTLYSIAKAYNVDVNYINTESGNQALTIGEILNIPDGEIKTSKTAVSANNNKNFVIHEVLAKETIYGICKQYQIDEAALIEMNPEIASGLKIGMQLKIPVKTDNNSSNKKSNAAVATKDPSTLPNESSRPRKERKISKDTLDIALMLPLYLDKVDEAPDNKKSFSFISMYEGAMIAIDSFSSTVNLRIHVYDVTDDINTAKKALAESDIISMDLIFGPLFIKSFRLVSEFANANAIPIVNPLTDKNDITNNQPYTIKLKTPNTLQYKAVLDLIHKEYPKYKLIVLVDDSTTLTSEIKDFKKITDSGSFQLVNYSSNGYAVISKYTNNNEKIAIISLLNKENHVTSLVTYLATQAKNNNIIVFGSSKWLEFDNIEPEYLQKINTHYYNDYYTNFADTNVIKFSEKFYSKYETLPDERAFISYDFMLFILDKMAKYNTKFFNHISDEEYDALHCKFSFKKTGTNNGYYNSGTNILLIKDFQLYRK